jgi:hypothetical protein
MKGSVDFDTDYNKCCMKESVCESHKDIVPKLIKQYVYTEITHSHNMDEDIIEFYRGHNSGNKCGITYKCGCRCFHVSIDGKQYCKDHIILESFIKCNPKKSKSILDSNNTKPNIEQCVKNIPIRTLSIFNMILLFNTLPAEIAINIIIYMRICDLKRLYEFKIPIIMELVQGDLIFNRTAIYKNMEFTRRYKFKTPYVEGLYTLSRVNKMISIFGSYDKNIVLYYIFETYRLFKDDDEQYYKDDVYSFNITSLYYKEKYSKSVVNYTIDGKPFEFKDIKALHPKISHSIGFRRILPVSSEQQLFNCLNNSIYNDQFINKTISKSETHDSMYGIWF